MAVQEGKFRKLYITDLVLPWISHIFCSFIPALIMCKMGEPMVQLIKNYLPMDGLAMKTLFTVGSLLPAVGVAILLKQVITKITDFLPFFFGFVLAAGMGLNLIGAAIVGGMFAIINYKIQMTKLNTASTDMTHIEEEDI